MIIYPDKPWYDGQEFGHTSQEGLKYIGTYDQENNTWSFRYIEPVSNPERPRIFSNTPPGFNPNVIEEEQDLIIGDIWYDTSDPNNAVKNIWDGDSWVPIQTLDAFQTTATLPTAPGDFAKALRQLAPYGTYDDEVPFQKDVNQLFNTTSSRVL